MTTQQKHVNPFSRYPSATGGVDNENNFLNQFNDNLNNDFNDLYNFGNGNNMYSSRFNNNNNYGNGGGKGLIDDTKIGGGGIDNYSYVGNLTNDTTKNPSMLFDSRNHNTSTNSNNQSSLHNSNILDRQGSFMNNHKNQQKQPQKFSQESFINKHINKHQEQQQQQQQQQQQSQPDNNSNNKFLNGNSLSFSNFEGDENILEDNPSFSFNVSNPNINMDDREFYGINSQNNINNNNYDNIFQDHNNNHQNIDNQYNNYENPQVEVEEEQQDDQIIYNSNGEARTPGSYFKSKSPNMGGMSGEGSIDFGSFKDSFNKMNLNGANGNNNSNNNIENERSTTSSKSNFNKTINTSIGTVNIPNYPSPVGYTPERAYLDYETYKRLKERYLDKINDTTVNISASTAAITPNNNSKYNGNSSSINNNNNNNITYSIQNKESQNKSNQIKQQQQQQPSKSSSPINRNNDNSNNINTNILDYPMIIIEKNIIFENCELEWTIVKDIVITNPHLKPVTLSNFNIYGLDRNCFNLIVSDKYLPSSSSSTSATATTLVSNYKRNNSMIIIEPSSYITISIQYLPTTENLPTSTDGLHHANLIFTSTATDSTHLDDFYSTEYSVRPISNSGIVCNFSIPIKATPSANILNDYDYLYSYNIWDMGECDSGSTLTSDLSIHFPHGNKLAFEFSGEGFSFEKLPNDKIKLKFQIPKSQIYKGEVNIIDKVTGQKKSVQLLATINNNNLNQNKQQQQPISIDTLPNNHSPNSLLISSIREKNEKEKERERIEIEKFEKERIEKERIQRENIERERQLEKERLEREFFEKEQIKYQQQQQQRNSKIVEIINQDNNNNNEKYHQYQPIISNKIPLKISNYVLENGIKMIYEERKQIAPTDTLPIYCHSNEPIEIECLSTLPDVFVVSPLKILVEPNSMIPLQIRYQPPVDILSHRAALILSAPSITKEKIKIDLVGVTESSTYMQIVPPSPFQVFRGGNPNKKFKNQIYTNKDQDKDYDDNDYDNNNNDNNNNPIQPPLFNQNNNQEYQLDNSSVIFHHNDELNNVLTNNSPSLYCNKKLVHFGGVRLGESKTITITLTSTLPQALHLNATFKQSKFGKYFSVTSGNQLLILPNSKSEVEIQYSPLSVDSHDSVIVFSSLNKELSFSVPVIGYGGKAKMEVFSSARDFRDSTNGIVGTILYVNRQSDDGKILYCTFSIKNTGQRSGFIRAISSFSNSRSIISPDRVVIGVGETQEFRLTIQPYNGDVTSFMNQIQESLKSSTISHGKVKLFYGDELSRLRCINSKLYRLEKLKSTSSGSDSNSSNDNQISFEGDFLYDYKYKEDYENDKKLRELLVNENSNINNYDANDYNLDTEDDSESFYQQLSSIKISPIIGNPPIVSNNKFQLNNNNDNNDNSSNKRVNDNNNNSSNNNRSSSSNNNLGNSTYNMNNQYQDDNNNNNNNNIDNLFLASMKNNNQEFFSDVNKMKKSNFLDNLNDVNSALKKNNGFKSKSMFDVGSNNLLNQEQQKSPLARPTPVITTPNPSSSSTTTSAVSSNSATVNINSTPIVTPMNQRQKQQEQILQQDQLLQNQKLFQQQQLLQKQIEEQQKELFQKQQLFQQQQLEFQLQQQQLEKQKQEQKEIKTQIKDQVSPPKQQIKPQFGSNNIGTSNLFLGKSSNKPPISSNFINNSSNNNNRNNNIGNGNINTKSMINNIIPSQDNENNTPFRATTTAATTFTRPPPSPSKSSIQSNLNNRTTPIIDEAQEEQEKYNIKQQQLQQEQLQQQQELGYSNFRETLIASYNPMFQQNQQFQSQEQHHEQYEDITPIQQYSTNSNSDSKQFNAFKGSKSVNFPNIPNSFLNNQESMKSINNSVRSDPANSSINQMKGMNGNNLLDSDGSIKIANYNNQNISYNREEEDDDYDKTKNYGFSEMDINMNSTLDNKVSSPPIPSDSLLFSSNKGPKRQFDSQFSNTQQQQQQQQQLDISEFDNNNQLFKSNNQNNLAKPSKSFFDDSITNDMNNNFNKTTTATTNNSNSSFKPLSSDSFFTSNYNFNVSTAANNNPFKSINLQSPSNNQLSYFNNKKQNNSYQQNQQQIGSYFRDDEFEEINNNNSNQSFNNNIDNSNNNNYSNDNSDNKKRIKQFGFSQVDFNTFGNTLPIHNTNQNLKSILKKTNYQQQSTIDTNQNKHSLFNSLKI